MRQREEEEAVEGVRHRNERAEIACSGRGRKAQGLKKLKKN